MSMDYDTIGSFVDYEASLDISHSKLQFKSRFGSGDHEIIMNSSSIVDRYYDYIMARTRVYTFSDREYVRYKFKPKLLCYEKYGTTELWALLLKINNWISVSEFDAKTIRIFNDDILDVLNEILIDQEDDITKNDLTIKDGYEKVSKKTAETATTRSTGSTTRNTSSTDSTTSSNYVTRQMLSEALQGKVDLSDLATVALTGLHEDLLTSPIEGPFNENDIAVFSAEGNIVDSGQPVPTGLTVMSVEGQSYLYLNSETGPCGNGACLSMTSLIYRGNNRPSNESGVLLWIDTTNVNTATGKGAVLKYRYDTNNGVLYIPFNFGSSSNDTEVYIGKNTPNQSIDLWVDMSDDASFVPLPEEYNENGENEVYVGSGTATEETKLWIDTNEEGTNNA